MSERATLVSDEMVDDAIFAYVRGSSEYKRARVSPIVCDADDKRRMRAALEAVFEGLDTFDGLSMLAQRMLDMHYPADLPLVCDRNSDSPGARLTAALRDCLEARNA